MIEQMYRKIATTMTFSLTLSKVSLLPSSFVCALELPLDPVSFFRVQYPFPLRMINL